MGIGRFLIGEHLHDMILDLFKLCKPQFLLMVDSAQRLLRASG